MKYRVKKILFNNNKSHYYPQYRFKFIPIWNYFHIEYLNGNSDRIIFYTEKEALDFINNELGNNVKNITYINN